MGLREEGLRAFGAWEPLAHRLRTGDASRGAAVGYDWEHTEEFVKGLKERGFNLFITHFSKGYGIEAETEERENTRRIAELCHKHGLYVGGYIRYTTFIPESMRHEAPDCVEKFGSVTVRGTPSHYGTQYWRHIPCPTSTAWLDYLDRLIEIGMKDVGLDCLHVDGMSLRGEPFACHCERCKTAFREWMMARYPTEESRKRRFGIGVGLDFFEPPDFTCSGKIVMPLPVVGDPLAQEWMFFRCDLLAKNWKFIVDSAKRHNPDAVVQANSTMSPGQNTTWYGALLRSKLAAAGNEGFFTEEGNAPNLTPDGRLHGYFETFKKHRRLGLLTFTYNREPITHEPCTESERLKRAVAHQMAFNKDSAGVFCCRVTDWGVWPATVPEYMAFHRERRDLWLNARQAHDVALYYSERTRALNAGTPIATTNIVRDVLMRAHVPFGYLIEERRAELGEFRSVVLPEVECMTDDEAADLAAYVRDGGGLVILGANTGDFDELRCRRPRNALASALGLEWSDGSPSSTARVGKGRVAFMPMLVTPEGTPAELVAQAGEEDDPYFRLKPTEWHAARNGGDMVRMLRWTAKAFRLEPIVPDTVVAEFVMQEDPARYLVHLVNFDLENDVGPFEILCNGVTPCSAEAHTPDGNAPAVEIAPAQADAPAALRVDGFHRYLVVAVGVKNRPQ